MTNLKKIGLVGVSSVFALVALTGSAFAQGAKESSSGDGYGYEFDDDPLSAGGFGPNDSRIRVRRGAQRSTLIKPRTQFITELLKSVENL
ncbi:MAG TPA: hypothetical protein VLC09_15705 [Polyangiaceae bacterium]|nr:hypothetical protein [Polyangiaceae bacterium]